MKDIVIITFSAIFLFGVACEVPTASTAAAPAYTPNALLVGAATPPELDGPPVGRASLSCDGVYMKCETRKRKTRCWCSDTRVVAPFE